MKKHDFFFAHGQTTATHASKTLAMPGNCSDKTSSEKMKTLPKWLSMPLMILLALCMATYSQAQSCISVNQLGMNQYSRVIDATGGAAFNTNEWVQPDFDSTNANVYIPSTLVSGGNNSDFWANVHTNGVANFISGVTINNTEKTYAVKRDYASGDVITAGSVVVLSSMTYYTVMFVMRQTSGGTVSWCNYYFQANTPITNHVMVTIARNGDIVAAASTLSGSDDIIIARIQGGGTLRYYEDRSVAAGTNTSEAYPTINGITATTDYGFVVVGSSGYGPSIDYVEAMVMMFDQGYSGIGFSTLNWVYTYRSLRGTYNLALTGDRSSSYANGVMEDPGHVFHVVGYTTDADQNGASATYERGFIFSIDSTGARQPLPLGFMPTFGGSGYFVRFNNICTSTGSTTSFVTGWVQNTTNGSYKTILASFDVTNTTVLWSKVYGSGSSGAVDKGFLVYPQANGVIAAGISNELTSSNTEPAIIAADVNGNSQSYVPCSSSFSLTYYGDANDSVPLTSVVLTQAASTSQTTIVNAPCIDVEDICGGCSSETPGTQTYYSRVLDNNFYSVPAHSTQITMQADQDASGNIITANRIYANGRTEILLTSTAPNNALNFSKDYYIAGTGHLDAGDDAMAVKVAANGDIIVAGIMDLHNGDDVIFLMRVSSTGTLIWQNNYDQSTVNLIDGNVVVTETTDANTDHDIVAVASADPLNIRGPDYIDMLRTHSNGTIEYHAVTSIQAALPGGSFNSTQYNPYIKGIVATGSDGSFAICGTTGFGPDTDYYGALIIKYDYNYSSALSPTWIWSYVYARPPASLPYSLHKGTNYNSVNFANAMVYDATHNYIIVAGNSDNSDDSLDGATFRDGFLLSLTNPNTPPPTLNWVTEIVPSSGFLNLFGLTVNGSSHYILTGSYLSSSSLKTVALDINPSTWVLAAGKTYGNSSSTDYGCSIFNNSTHGYIMAGFTYDNSINNSYPYLQVNLISVDNSLALGTSNDCSNSFSPDIVSDPSHDVGAEQDIPSPPTFTNIQAITLTEYNLCGGMFDLCSSASSETMFPVVKGLSRNGMENTLNIYPNPAFSSLDIDLVAGAGSTGVITITDIEGRKVSRSGINIAEGSNHYELDISSLKPGLYFVELVNANGTSYPVTKISKY